MNNDALKSRTMRIPINIINYKNGTFIDFTVPKNGKIR